MVKKWQFVSNQVEDGAGKDEKTRKIVRKAAMKAFRRNQRLERSREFIQENDDQQEVQTLDGTAENGSSDASAVEHRLLSIRVSSPTKSPRNQLEAAVYEACRITALMCSNCIFREFTPQAVAFRGLKKSLRLALNEIETSDAENARDFEELLGFILSAGGCRHRQRRNGLPFGSRNRW